MILKNPINLGDVVTEEPKPHASEPIIIYGEHLPLAQFGYGKCKTFLCPCWGFTPDSSKKGYCTCGHHGHNHEKA